MAVITTIQIRRGTLAQWTTANPVLALGEAGYESDTTKLKFGDGATAYLSLPYFTGGTGLSTTLADGFVFVGNVANIATGVAVSGDLTAVNTGAFTVAKIQTTVVSGTTGSGNVVFSTSPTLVTPALGTPSSATLTNATGLPVAGGGTGVASFTAYAPIFGGTTTTGPLQSGTVGTVGQVLTSNGAGALPTFQAGGAGSIGINDLTDAVYDTATDFNMNLGSNTAQASGSQFNVYVGQGAGNPSGSTSATDGNTALGYNALTALTSGDSNTAIGKNSLTAISSGVANTAVGLGALAAITTNNSSTAVGYAALFACTGGSNTSIGQNSGGTITSGTSNTFVGASADSNSATGVNRTTIGANAVCTANNSVQLGDGNVSTGFLGGQPIHAGLTVIASGSFGAVTLVDITSIPTTYRSLVLYVNGASNTVATRALRVDIDAGQGFGASNINTTQISGTTTTLVSTTSPWTEVTQTAAQTSSCVINMPAYQSGPIKQVNGTAKFAQTAGTDWLSAGATNVIFIGTLNDGSVARTGAITGIRITWNNVATGVFDAGTYALYGVN